eukprot:6935601-Heterocapsa_arctica.AAC.1
MSFRAAASCAIPQHTIYASPGLCARIRSTAVCLEAIRNKNCLARAYRRPAPGRYHRRPHRHVRHVIPVQ